MANPILLTPPGGTQILKAWRHLQNIYKMTAWAKYGQIILSFKVSFLLKIFENDDKSCTFFCQYLVSFPRLQLLMTFVDAFQQVLQGFYASNNLPSVATYCHSQQSNQKSELTKDQRKTSVYKETK
jgi:hypothetical protein